MQNLTLFCQKRFESKKKVFLKITPPKDRYLLAKRQKTEDFQ